MVFKHNLINKKTKVTDIKPESLKNEVLTNDLYKLLEAKFLLRKVITIFTDTIWRLHFADM